MAILRLLAPVPAPGRQQHSLLRWCNAHLWGADEGGAPVQEALRPGSGPCRCPSSHGPRLLESSPPAASQVPWVSGWGQSCFLLTIRDTK